MTKEPVDLIQSAFIERKSRNQNYSLRSFARDLGISPAQLSKLLNKKISLTRWQAAKIAAALNLSKAEASLLVRDVILSASPKAKVPKDLREMTARNAAKKKNAILPMTDYSVERFKAISQWYHLPLLELTYLDSFKADENWIAEKLGIALLEVRDAIRRLLELGLLEKCPDRGLRKTINRLFINSKSEPEVRKYERSMIEKGIKRLEKMSGPELDMHLFNSITFPVSKETIPEIRQAVIEFQRKILSTLQKKPYEEVYQMNCQLFPITQSKVRKKT